MQPRPSLCPLEAAPDHTDMRRNGTQRVGLAEADSDGCLGPRWAVMGAWVPATDWKGEKEVFWKKDGRVCPGEWRNAT